MCVYARARVWVGGWLLMRACECGYAGARACACASARVALFYHQESTCSILHCYLLLLWLHHIFYISHKRHKFRIKFIDKENVCFDFFFVLYLKHFLYNKNSARYCHKCRNVFMKSTCYCCQIFIKLDISQQVLEKNTKFH